MTGTAGTATSEVIRAVHRRSAPWPYAGLDVAAMVRRGWRPTPIHDVVLKVHQRCNLACDYCYVYEHADQSWRRRPAVMAPEIWRAAVSRIRAHVCTHELASIRVVLHGGEPLLYGPARLGELADAIRAAMPDFCAVQIGLQTNGVRLDAAMAEVLIRHGIRAGVSVDGVAENHDRHRRTRSGRGSFDAVAGALELMRAQYRAAYAGILCTVAPDTDPIECYEQLAKFDPPMIDFLLPHANWDQPPPGRDGGHRSYAGWLIAAFDHWYGPGSRVRVRLFEDVMSLVLGGRSHGEQVGLSPSGVLVVESDGAIEQVDALKSAYEGACATGLDVRHDDFDSALLDPGIVARQIGVEALPEECHRCELVEFCGGGHYAHRYRGGAGFRNPSVYCPDLKAFIRHVYLRVQSDLRQLASMGEP